MNYEINRKIRVWLGNDYDLNILETSEWNLKDMNLTNKVLLLNGNLITY